MVGNKNRKVWVFTSGYLAYCKVPYEMRWTKASSAVYRPLGLIYHPQLSIV